VLLHRNVRNWTVRIAQCYCTVMLTQSVWRNSDAYRRDFVSSECGTNCSKTINVVCFLLGNSPASEFYMPTFRKTLSQLHRQVGAEWLNLRIAGVSIREKVWLENSLSQLEGG